MRGKKFINAAVPMLAGVVWMGAVAGIALASIDDHGECCVPGYYSEVSEQTSWGCYDDYDPETNTHNCRPNRRPEEVPPEQENFSICNLAPNSYFFPNWVEPKCNKEAESLCIPAAGVDGTEIQYTPRYIKGCDDATAPVCECYISWQGYDINPAEEHQCVSQMCSP